MLADALEDNGRPARAAPLAQRDGQRGAERLVGSAHHGAKRGCLEFRGKCAAYVHLEFGVAVVAG